MRQIKFRGKRLKDGVWMYGDLVHLERNFEKIVKILDWSMIGDKEKDDDLTVDPATVGQFTGLFDKNGKEIYEGDFVRHYYAGYIYLVEYIGGGFGCCRRLGEISFSLFEPDALVVIGNIHDSPELLKTE